MKASILVVDDERSLAELISTVLTQAGYKVYHAGDADTAFAFLKRELVDLILLDIELPGISGFNFLEILKRETRTASLPVIMITVLGAESYRVRGLDGGADDYLIKPFSTKELRARVDALLRRVGNTGKPDNLLQAGLISMSLDRNEVSVEAQKISLTPAEFDLLAILMRRKGYVLSYQTLIEALSTHAREVTSQTLYTHVKNLRKKLMSQGVLIETVHGVGYKFTAA